MERKCRIIAEQSLCLGESFILIRFGEKLQTAPLLTREMFSIFFLADKHADVNVGHQFIPPWRLPWQR